MPNCKEISTNSNRGYLRVGEFPRTSLIGLNVFWRNEMSVLYFQEPSRINSRKEA